jgi:hypothetical protein
VLYGKALTATARKFSLELWEIPEYFFSRMNGKEIAASPICIYLLASGLITANVKISLSEIMRI